jgi:hypothetical protein
VRIREERTREGRIARGMRREMMKIRTRKHGRRKCYRTVTESKITKSEQGHDKSAPIIYDKKESWWCNFFPLLIKKITEHFHQRETE